MRWNVEVEGYSSLNGIVTVVSVETGKPLITTFSQRNVPSALHGIVEGERMPLRNLCPRIKTKDPQVL